MPARSLQHIPSYSMSRSRRIEPRFTCCLAGCSTKCCWWAAAAGSMPWLGSWRKASSASTCTAPQAALASALSQESPMSPWMSPTMLRWVRLHYAPVCHLQAALGHANDSSHSSKPSNTLQKHQAQQQVAWLKRVTPLLRTAPVIASQQRPAGVTTSHTHPGMPCRWLTGARRRASTWSWWALRRRWWPAWLMTWQRLASVPLAPQPLLHSWRAPKSS